MTELSNKMLRNSRIDFMKAFVIVLLPLFHLSDKAASVLGVYQMPTLMLIAGYLYAHKDAKVFIKSKVRRLLIPFVIWKPFISMKYMFQTQFVRLLRGYLIEKHGF